jgi:hypothetical protein
MHSFVIYRSYPLLNFSPLPGKIPTKIILPLNAQHASSLNYSNFKDVYEDDKRSEDDEVQDHIASKAESNNVLEHVEQQQNDSFSSSSPLPQSFVTTSLPMPMNSWARNQPPFIYVQQVIMRSMVLPWSQDLLLLTDAFRAPLFEVFKLLEVISNHETNVTLSNLCLHVDTIKRTHKDVLFPEYNCLVLSPANFWKQNLHNFNKDNCLLSTIFQHHVSINFLLICCCVDQTSLINLL